MTREDELTDALLGCYQQAGEEVKYWAHRYREALRRNGGLATAKRMLKPRNTGQRAGLDVLLEAGRPDLTTEAIVLAPKFRGLFTNAELAVAAKRLGEYLASRRFPNVGGQETEEVDYFFNADDKVTTGSFVFRPGHNAKKTGTVDVTHSKKSTKATLLHNEIQNALFKKLISEHGTNCVGTENATGHGTSIDIVVKTKEFCWFYEIKTARSVKACIRQAIPQLLEYAYWDGTNDKADRLIIVGRKVITKQGDAYLQFLRSEFGLDISYESFEASKIGKKGPP